MAGVDRHVLAINCGSSSLKFGLYSTGSTGIRLISEGEGERIGTPQSQFWFQKESEDKHEEKLDLPDHQSAVDHAWKTVEQQGPSPDAVGHRIVHGGSQVTRHELLNDSILQQLQQAVDFAPLHVPPALKAIEAITKRIGSAPQVVCLDDAFHATMPDVSMFFALSAKVREKGVKRYGFHGLSLESIVAQLNPLPSRLVVAHLGSGCSVTAIKDGKSVDTTMGLTPTGGMMMGTRCGDLDPGAILFLLRSGFSKLEELEELVDHDSGLKGVSGISSDLREVEKAARDNPQADLARRMFIHQLIKSIAAMAASAGGIDKLVFAGGIGEHNAALREEVCRKLSFLGPFKSLVLPSEEDLQIATITARLAFA